MTLLNIKILRNCMASVLVGFSGFTLGQDVVVEEFTPGVVVSSASVNSNFGKLADKTNDNAARLVAAESNISSVASAVSGVRYHWYGYTSQAFDREMMGFSTSGFSLSTLCKTEFGNDAFVATELALEQIIRSGGDFDTPNDAAYIIYEGTRIRRTFNGSNILDALRNPFWEVAFGLMGGPAIIRGSASISSPQGNELAPVACVAIR